MARHLKPTKRHKMRKVSVDEKDSSLIVNELKSKIKRGNEDYREQSFAIHGMICAKCGREFDHKTRHLLTVHHRDGNHHNNPPDGSNWENLCVYCHEDEHQRDVLTDYYIK